jgi:hypothetical protein
MSFHIVLRSNDTCSCCCRFKMEEAMPLLLLQQTSAYLQSHNAAATHVPASKHRSAEHHWQPSNMLTCMPELSSGAHINVANL